MEGLFDNSSSARAAFVSFGPSQFVPDSPPRESLDLEPCAKSNRAAIRTNCPRLPGVYGIRDEFAELIYVGMSVHLRDRLLSYFTKGPPESKQQRIARRARHVTWEVGEHEFVVMLRELELIRHWRPRYNARGRPERQKTGHIYLSSGEAPNFRIGSPPRTCQRQWGPLPLNRRLRESVKRLNHEFKLRDCPTSVPIRYAEQRQLFVVDSRPACIRGELARCLAPCAGGCTQREYQRNVLGAVALLDGRDRAILDESEQAMKEAAANCDFERAASCRDTWEPLAYLHDQLELLRNVRSDYWFVYPLSAHSRKTLWVLIAGGNVASVLPKPDSRAAAARYRKLLEETLAQKECEHRSEDFEQIRLVASWFRQRPDELQRALEPDQVASHCQRCDFRRNRRRLRTERIDGLGGPSYNRLAQ
jgi:excinuclease ABC subunit C